ncbi:MAG: CHAT domain-containing protein [Candidatus Eremiobacteraeota bacterium]|nr:CHAT domain-containing protein [Candidatus Eremiobacteraeota bacterium]
MREYRYGQALRAISSEKSEEASVLRFVILRHLGLYHEAAMLLKTIDIRAVSERDSFDQVQFFIARGAIESDRSDDLEEKNYREAIRRSKQPDEEIKARLTLANSILSRKKTADAETRELYEQAGLLLQDAKYPETLSYFLLQQANLLKYSGLKEQVTPLYLAALDKAESANLPLVAATCYRNLAWDFKRRRENSRAYDLMRKAVRICTAEDEWQEGINLLTSLSFLHEDSVESEEFYKNELLYALNSNPPLQHRLRLYALLSRAGGAEAENWARKGLQESTEFPDERVILLKALATELEGKAPAEEVLDLYRQAEKIAEPKAYREYYGLESSLGVVRYDLAQALLTEHQYQEAREMLDKAASAEQEPGRRWYLCRALCRASDTSLRLGDLESARVYFRKVVEQIQSAENETEASILAAGLLYIHTYSALLEGMESDPSSLILGMPPLAEQLLRSELKNEDTYRLFIDIFDREIDKNRQASLKDGESLRYRGILYEATDRREEARQAYQAALDQGGGGNRNADLIARFWLANLAYKEGGWESAREELRKSLPTAADTSDSDYFYIAVGWVELELENYPAALEMFQRVESRRSKPLALYGAARAQIGLQQYEEASESVAQALQSEEGRNLALQGRLHLQRGEAKRLGGRPEESRQDYLVAIDALQTTRQWAPLLEAYLGLQKTMDELDRDSEAAEAYGKATAILKSVGNQIDPGKLRSPGLLELTSSSSRQPSEIGRTVASDRQEFLLLQERLKRRHPEEIKSNSPYSPSQILAARDTLTDDSAIVLVQSFSSETYISAITRNEIVSRELGIGRAEILSHEKELLASLRQRNNGSTIPRRQLYNFLILPVEEILGRKIRWRFLPTPEVQNLPLGALIDSKGSTVSRERIVSFLPLDPNRAPTGRSATRDTGILLIGAPTGQNLEGARSELQQLGSQFPKSSLLIGRDATTSAFLREIENYPVVHIASHASPEGIELDDKSLSLQEIFEAALNPGTLVVLSACETARSEAHASSLAEAFQIAGASAVIASLWRVDDQATAELFRQFYSYIRDGHPPDEALTLAQRQMQESGPWQHPYFWGAFVLTESAQAK